MNKRLVILSIFVVLALITLIFKPHTSEYYDVMTPDMSYYTSPDTECQSLLRSADGQLSQTKALVSRAMKVCNGQSQQPQPPSLPTPVPLGIYDLGPWNLWSKHGTYDFTDKSARWIWFHPDGATFTEYEGRYINKVHTFSTTLTVPQRRTVTLHIIVDNYADVSLNGVPIKKNVGGGWGSGSNYPKLQMTLRPGANILNIACKNTGGPGGLLASVIDTQGRVLSRTNTQTWRYGHGDITRPQPLLPNFLPRLNM
jgi:hypothetical protein